MITRIIAAATVLSSVVTGIVACGEDQDTTATGTNSLTLAVSNVVDAIGSSTRAELVKNVDYGQQAPTWTFAETTLQTSPASFEDLLSDLPQGEFSLMVVAEPAPESATGAAQKGLGCELSLILGEREDVTVSIDGLNAFGDKGYGQCTAEVTRR